MPKPFAMRSGFSLVELSIVLVILGLLVGGIIVGKSMVRSAQVRSVVTEYERYTASAQAFDNKYGSLPGDLRNATSYWGDNASLCSDAGITDGVPGACNGNGDGWITGGGAASATAESFQFWNQLALGGFIGGKFTGAAGPDACCWPGNDAIIGTNVPASRLPQGGWAVFYLNVYNSGDPVIYDGEYRNVMIMGARIGGNYPLNGALRPDEAKSVDDKLDDGFPGSGIQMLREPNGFGHASGNTCSTSANSADKPGAYKLTNTNRICNPWFVNII